MQVHNIGPFVLDFNIMLMHSILSNSGLKWQSKRSKGWIRRVYRLAIGLFYNIQPRKQIGHLKQNPKPASLCKFTVTVGLIGYHFYLNFLLYFIYTYLWALTIYCSVAPRLQISTMRLSSQTVLHMYIAMDKNLMQGNTTLERVK